MSAASCSSVRLISLVPFSDEELVGGHMDTFEWTRYNRSTHQTFVLEVDQMYDRALPQVTMYAKKFTSRRYERILPTASNEDQKRLEECLEQILGVTGAIKFTMKANRNPSASSRGRILLLSKHRAIYGQKLIEGLQASLRRVGNIPVEGGIHLLACLSYTTVIIRRVLSQGNTVFRYFQPSFQTVCCSPPKHRF